MNNDINLSKIIDDKKFMWDGREYSSSGQARDIASEYARAGFEVQVINEGKKFLVYTRRLAAIESQ